MEFFSEYLRKKFSCPVHRVPINLPFLCPGRISHPRQICAFCHENGALAPHLRPRMPLEEQVSKGIEYVRKRYGRDCLLIAYFQNFTPTNSEPDEFRSALTKALSLADFTAAIVATRPDCLPDPILMHISEIAEKIETWIELGVQTSHDRTLDAMNRGHSFEQSADAAKRIVSAGIKCAAQVILGLPGETVEDFRSTAKALSPLPFSAIKIHNLLVLKGTGIAAKYLKDKSYLSPMDEYEYAIALSSFISGLPPEWLLMRICADADPRDIIAPKWKMGKAQFIEYFKTYHANPESFPKGRAKIVTEDGSMTFYNVQYREHYHTIAGAKSEAENKFIIPGHLRERLEKGGKTRILDIGFGLGYNAFCSLKIAEMAKKGFLEIVSIDKDEDCIGLAKLAFSEDMAGSRIAESLADNMRWEGDFSSLGFFIADARDWVRSSEERFDIIFLDAFSTEKNPELWTYDFLRAAIRLLDKNGIIISYSSAYPFRGALVRCGLKIGETAPFGRKRGGTIAAFSLDFIGEELPPKELAIISKSTAGIPYRDPGLRSSQEEILGHRRKLSDRLRARGVPKWIKMT